MKCIYLIAILLMPTAFLEPGQPSLIPTVGVEVKLHGMFNGKIQDYNADLVAFVAKSNEINKTIFAGEDCCNIRVQNTSFVMKNGNDKTGLFEYFNKPFLTIGHGSTMAGPAGLHPHRCTVVYSGDYVENIVLQDNANIFFHPGANVIGNITLAPGCHLHFSNGCTVTGDIIAALAGNYNITGSVVHNGQITITGPSTIVTAYGKELKTASVADGTFNCYFETLSTDVSSTIVGSGTANININTLKVKSALYVNSVINFSGNILNIYNSEIISASAVPASSAILFSGTTGSLWNSKVVSTTFAVCITGDGLFTAYGNYLESTVLNAVSWQNLTIAKIVLRRNYITVANNAGNMDCVGVKSTQFLVLEENTLIAAGTGTSVISNAAVNIKSLRGNGSNANVDVSITETIDVIFQNNNYE